ncbi:MAG: 2,3-diphosphoglycerate-dependent phosphoglycerate mutase [Deltaproteobacteria bacterium]|jgi:2,3-bisphosphoglycerate-dependent phosphoglycerate mutase|nr:2,3-diphosphoglycerate-dependent phosphoglycerate mutase [Deltaproteobacteria bacterium]
MHKLVIVRHGESIWNQENRFTGWHDVGLSEKGMMEAKKGGQALKKENLIFDVAYTSVLKRAIKTLDFILEETDQVWLPVLKEWRLNERHYGNLQGLNKSEMAQQHGEEQVKIWRRSYDVPPPEMSLTDARHPKNDIRYKNVALKDLPGSESLKDTVARFIPLWTEKIVPDLKRNKKVLIAAHGNSLRALIMNLEGLSPEEIMQVNVPTGIPISYELDESFKVISKKFLGDPEEVEKAIQSVANQGKKN